MRPNLPVDFSPRYLIGLPYKNDKLFNIECFIDFMRSITEGFGTIKILVLLYLPTSVKPVAMFAL